MGVGRSDSPFRTETGETMSSTKPSSPDIREFIRKQREQYKLNSTTAGSSSPSAQSEADIAPATTAPSSEPKTPSQSSTQSVAKNLTAELSGDAATRAESQALGNVKASEAAVKSARSPIETIPDGLFGSPADFLISGQRASLPPAAAENRTDSNTPATASATNGTTDGGAFAPSNTHVGEPTMSAANDSTTSDATASGEPQSPSSAGASLPVIDEGSAAVLAASPTATKVGSQLEPLSMKAQPDAQGAVERCLELERLLDEERKNNAQLRITLLAYEKELQTLYEERNQSGSMPRDDRLIEEMSDGMRELYDQITRLSESNRQKAEEALLLEEAFRELKKRYDQVKHLAKDFKQNEAQLMEALSKTKAQLGTTQTKFRALRVQAQEKLDKASQQIDSLKQVSEREIAVLKARVLKYEANLLSKEDAIRQKEIENRKITQICDRLISRLEQSNSVLTPEQQAEMLRETTTARTELLTKGDTSNKDSNKSMK